MNIVKRCMQLERQEGRAEGRMLGRIEGKLEGIIEGVTLGERVMKKSLVINLIKGTDFSEEKIANLVKAPVYFVKKVKKRMASGN